MNAYARKANAGNRIDPLERHFSTKEIAEAWGVERETVLRIFELEPGVLRLGPVKEVRRRTRRELRIPASVLERVYAERISRR